jgi:hypothetical protein
MIISSGKYLWTFRARQNCPTGVVEAASLPGMPGQLSHYSDLATGWPTEESLGF